MLLPAEDFRRLKLRSKDGDIGKALEFLFDDHFWVIRYLVANTGDWLRGRQVLISPYALEPANLEEDVLPVQLTQDQIERSPPLETHQPVSRQFEALYHEYYEFPYYGWGPYSWGASPILQRNVQEQKDAIRVQESWDPHLRSTKDVIGHHVQAADGEVGHVEDFIVDEESWTIRYVVVYTKNWIPGKRILVAPQWITRVSWEESKIFVAQSVEMLTSSPEYNVESLNRDYETRLYRHYGTNGYWVDEPVRAQPGR